MSTESTHTTAESIPEVAWVPESIQGKAKQAAGETIEAAFIDACQRVVWVCAGLAGLSALMTLLLIHDRPAKP